MIEVHILHLVLGVILFFLINWIGRHSYSVGYMQISMFLKVEEAPAFNFLFRIIGPIVYLFIVSAILYKIRLDKFVINIYFISIYYVLFRLLFNLVTNRGLLMNWYRQILYWISIISISYFAYSEIIFRKENILPDFETISNELWIIILIFLFQTFNQIRVSSDKTIKRKENYLESRYKNFHEKYGKFINENIKNNKLKSIVYALMIYEDFNRPKITRIAENISFILTKQKHSLGLMQVQTDNLITDFESVKLGIDKVKTAYERALKDRGLENINKEDFNNRGVHHYEWDLKRSIIKDYNPDGPYIYEVSELSNNIFDKFFSENKDYLTPYYNE
ncbi:hypothetical protein [Flagellimonas iocasae]|uniref:Transglycosylase SLT domain-containing protein n=1 Tax=Flagellimonas iocasae TaxID=2055905 RepID=A0ABW4XZY4_9FLAO